MTTAFGFPKAKIVEKQLDKNVIGCFDELSEGELISVFKKKPSGELEWMVVFEESGPKIFS